MLRALSASYLLADLLFIVGANSRCNHDLTAGTKVVRVTNPHPSLGITPPAVG